MRQDVTYEFQLLVTNPLQASGMWTPGLLMTANFCFKEKLALLFNNILNVSHNSAFFPVYPGPWL